MKLTPIDIQQQTFARAWRGIDQREVGAFLELVSGQFEDVLKENRSQKEDLRLQERELSSFREREQALKETMVTAQRVTNDLREQAKKEAEIIISEAELKAEKIMHNAHSRMVKILEEINELKRQRTQFIEALRGIIQTHHKLLDVVEEEGSTQIETTLTMFKKPAPPPPPVLNVQRGQFKAHTQKSAG